MSVRTEQAVLGILTDALVFMHAPCSREQVTMWREHLQLNAISRLLIDRLD